MPNGAIKENYTILMPETGIEWTNEPLCILGIYIGTNKSILQQLNYGPIKTKITNMLNIWSSRDLTMIGKNVVLKSHVMSKLIFAMSVIPTPDPIFLKSIESEMFRFLWNGNPEKIKRKVLYSSKYEGGLGITNSTIQDMALNITYVKRFLNNAELNIFVNAQLGDIGGLFWKCNLKKEMKG